MIGVIQKTENKLEFLYSNYILSLIIICSISLTLRIYFTHFELPLESQDAFIYLLQAKEIVNGNFNGLPNNIGWQFFLSIFFSTFDFKNNFEYMQIIRIVSIGIGVATIPLVYLIGRKFLDKKFSLLAASFFAFDPNLIENSIFGITESLFIFCSLVTIFFILQEKFRYIILVGIFSGLAFDIRLSGIVLLLVGLSSIFLIKSSPKQKTKKILLLLVMFTLTASPFFILNYQNYSDPIGSVFLIQEAIEQNIPPSADPSQMDLKFHDKLFIAITEEVKHIFRITIPFLALFVPFGIISLISKIQFKEKIIILVIIVSLIVAIPQYFLSVEYRNLFLILPMFSIISAVGVQYFIKNKKNQNLFLLMIVIGIIFLSGNMLRERSDVNLELLKEKEKFGMFVVNSYKGKIMGDLYTQIAHNLPNAKMSDEGLISNDSLELIGFGPPSKSINDLMIYTKERKITHLIIDDKYEKRSPEFVDVYFNEEKYSFLKRVFNSDDEGYKNLHVKIFEINYNKLE